MAIARIRTGHTKLSHSHLLNNSRPRLRGACNVPATTESLNAESIIKQEEDQVFRRTLSRQMHQPRIRTRYYHSARLSESSSTYKNHVTTLCIPQIFPQISNRVPTISNIKSSQQSLMTLVVGATLNREERTNIPEATSPLEPLQWIFLVMG